jgi:hypothetical protein
MNATTPRSDLLNLESDLCDAVHMARIAATLLERDLSNKAAHEKICSLRNAEENHGFA